MKEELKNIILMGLGAISMTGEKANDLKKELLVKGEALYKEGMVKNEELKRDIKEKIKDSVTVQVKSTTKEDVISAIKSMSSEEKQEIAKILGSNKETKTVKYNKNNNKD